MDATDGLRLGKLFIESLQRFFWLLITSLLYHYNYSLYRNQGIGKKHIITIRAGDHIIEVPIPK